MLDTRPIPMYMLGFPAGVQREIYATVVRELDDLSKKGLSPELTREYEHIISLQLDGIRRICLDKKVQSISPQQNLASYLMALEAGKPN